MHDRAHRTRGEWFLLALAIVAAAVFVRLGVWQLERLSERREINAARAAALSGKPVRFDRGRSSDPGTIDSVQWRRVQLEGHWDPEREVVIRGRAFLGTPGVQVATLFRPLDMSPVLVLRGWLPAADGVSADLDGRSIRRDTGLVRIHGLAIPFERPGPIPTRHLAFADGERPVLGTLDFETVSSELGVALSSWVLQLLPESGSADGYATSGTTSSTVEPASSLRRLPAPPPFQRTARSLRVPVVRLRGDRSRGRVPASQGGKENCRRALAEGRTAVSHRRWTDRAGRPWQVKPRSRSEWEFEPLPGNDGRARTARAPGWQDDPFELSNEELQRLFDAAPDPDRPRPPSPFGD